jgi:hypothetical protein
MLAAGIEVVFSNPKNAPVLYQAISSGKLPICIFTRRHVSVKVSSPRICHPETK